MRQITYISTLRTGEASSTFKDVERVSHANNARDDLSGLLMFDGLRFLQVLEGPEESVERALARIRADKRHFALVTLSDRTVERRSFGGWAMLCRDVGANCDTLEAMLQPFLANADRNTRATFESFAKIREAKAA